LAGRCAQHELTLLQKTPSRDHVRCHVFQQQ
jgi:hypothetical protein